MVIAGGPEGGLQQDCLGCMRSLRLPEWDVARRDRNHQGPGLGICLLLGDPVHS